MAEIPSMNDHPAIQAFQGDSSANARTKKNNQSILPNRIIAVFGTESSGSTFLATTLGIATGAFPPNGTYVTLPSDRHGNPGRTIVERVVAKRAMSPNREIEIQHLSLPWGMWFNPKMNCDPWHAKNTEIVEALVPEPCFRFDYEADWPHRLKVIAPAGCREEAHISEASMSKQGGEASWTCGAKCGDGANDGYALYPRRFFINITSHIEWYLSRGVDITAIVSVRDQSISHAGKMRVHCKDERIALAEEARARSIMGEALTRYGRKVRLKKHRFLEADLDKERTLAVSYEALMALREAYLFNIYRTLGINSTYIPDFKDGNIKYVDSKKK